MIRSHFRLFADFPPMVFDMRTFAPEYEKMEPAHANARGNADFLDSDLTKAWRTQE